MHHFKELLPEQYDQVAHDENVLRYPLINAVVSREQSGKVFVNGSNSFFIQHKAGFSLLISNNFSDIKDSIIELFNTKDIPTYFHIYNPPLWIGDLLNEKKDMFNIRSRNRIQLRADTLLSLSLKANDESSYSSDFTVAVIDEANFDKLHDLDLNIEAKFWDSKEHFLNNGFGVCLLSTINDKAIASCYSATLVDNVAEIDIKTSANKMNSGFGQIVANEFLRLSMRKEVVANWDCFTDNFGSVALAKKVGLKEIFNYPFISVFNKNKQP